MTSKSVAQLLIDLYVDFDYYRGHSVPDLEQILL